MNFVRTKTKHQTQKLKNLSFVRTKKIEGLKAKFGFFI